MKKGPVIHAHELLEVETLSHRKISVSFSMVDPVTREEHQIIVVFDEEAAAKLRTDLLTQ